MKLGTRTRAEPSVQTIVIPRQTQDGKQDDLVFFAKTVLNWDDFDKVCVEPKPPTVIRAGSNPGDPPQLNTADPTYLLAMQEHGRRRINWITIESLRATPDLTWNQVKPEDPSTWGKYFDEFREFGLSPTEIGKIIEGVFRANSLNDKMFDEARERFLAGQAQKDAK